MRNSVMLWTAAKWFGGLSMLFRKYPIISVSKNEPNQWTKPVIITPSLFSLFFFFFFCQHWKLNCCAASWACTQRQCARSGGSRLLRLTEQSPHISITSAGRVQVPGVSLCCCWLDFKKMPVKDLVWFCRLTNRSRSESNKHITRQQHLEGKQHHANLVLLLINLQKATTSCSHAGVVPDSFILQFTDGKSRAAMWKISTTTHTLIQPRQMKEQGLQKADEMRWNCCVRIRARVQSSCDAGAAEQIKWSRLKGSGRFRLKHSVRL